MEDDLSLLGPLFGELLRQQDQIYVQPFWSLSDPHMAHWPRIVLKSLSVSYSSLSCSSVKPASPAETFSLGLLRSTTVPLNLYVAADVTDAPAIMAIAATVMCSKVPHRRKVPGFGTRTVMAAVRAVPVAPPITPKATAVFLSIEMVFFFLSLGPWTRNWTPTCFVPSR